MTTSRRPTGAPAAPEPATAVPQDAPSNQRRRKLSTPSKLRAQAGPNRVTCTTDGVLSVNGDTLTLSINQQPLRTPLVLAADVTLPPLPATVFVKMLPLTDEQGTVQAWHVWKLKVVERGTCDLQFFAFGELIGTTRDSWTLRITPEQGSPFLFRGIARHAFLRALPEVGTQIGVIGHAGVAQRFVREDARAPALAKRSEPTE